MQKRALAIHDISCVGRCSITVALPVLSAAGIDTGILPTALLSTHTGGFTGYTHLDLSDQILPIARHFHSLGIHFDALYTGYLASEQQADQILEVMDLLCDEETLIFVDPAFGDNGKMYGLLSPAMPGSMLKLCRRAHVIVPNLTEASFMLGKPFPAGGESQPELYRDLCGELRNSGVNGHILITDTRLSDKETGIVLLEREKDQAEFFLHPYIPGHFHGTGDVFASFLLGGILNQLPTCKAVELALKYTQISLQATLKNGSEYRYGLCFENCLGDFARDCRR